MGIGGVCLSCSVDVFFFFKQKTAYEVRISDWSSDVCSSDLDDFAEGWVLAPGRHEWPVVKAFCKAVAERLADAAPDRFIATMAKAKRRGRIFIDYLRNDRSATAIAPYSPRARPGAPVAWPVEWPDLANITASGAGIGRAHV